MTNIQFHVIKQTSDLDSEATSPQQSCSVQQCCRQLLPDTLLRRVWPPLGGKVAVHSTFQLKHKFLPCIKFSFSQWLAYRYRDWEILTWNTGNGINLRIPAPDELETKKPAVNGLIYERVQWKSNGSHAKRRR